MPSLSLWAGSGLITAGVATSAAVFAHDILRWRVTREMPQGAPKRLPPELHALAAIATGWGVGSLSHWWLGLAAAAAHGALAYGVIRRRIEGGGFS